MTKEDFQWYHAIDLGDEGVTVPVSDYSATWNNIREIRDRVSYEGKKVLDIASWDGMWAFEAEKRGASMVVAVDCVSMIGRQDIVDAQRKFLYAREKLQSNVIPYYDRSIHSLTKLEPITGKFDIIQNLGLLYHLENPWHALKQCRRMLNHDGIMILETACSLSTEATMTINRGDAAFYDSDPTTYWAPSVSCLKLMLESCLFEVVPGMAYVNEPNGKTKRVALIAKATTLGDIHEFFNDYRTAP
jgi:SAM-dependent methyltransferase